MRNFSKKILPVLGVVSALFAASAHASDLNVVRALLGGKKFVCQAGDPDAITPPAKTVSIKIGQTDLLSDTLDLHLDIEYASSGKVEKQTIHQVQVSKHDRPHGYVVQNGDQDERMMNSDTLFVEVNAEGEVSSMMMNSTLGFGIMPVFQCKL
jgi:hypothetical protein